MLAPPPAGLEPRYEIKLPVREELLPELRDWLLASGAGFVEAYPPRQVNNIYFDTPELETYHDSREGITERGKVRLRWYGDLPVVRTPTFEVKRKRAQEGWKISRRLDLERDLRKVSWPEMTSDVASRLDGEARLWLDACSEPILVNSYRREYYVTVGGLIRCTLDYGERDFAQQFHGWPNVERAIPPSGFMVVEVKSSLADARMAQGLVESLPFRVTRNSKYANAVEGAEY